MHAFSSTQLLVFQQSHFVQCVLDHAHENTDGLRCANQSLNRIACVFKVNTGCFEKSMQSVVVDATQRRCKPN